MPLSLWQRSSTVLGPPFEALPLKQDFAESSKCFEALFELIQQSHPLVEAHFEHILAVFSHILQNSAPTVSEEKAMIPSETRDQLVALKRVRTAAAATSNRSSASRIGYRFRITTQLIKVHRSSSTTTS
ncbi:hypothetical protein MJO29_015522 [Puccinia striiformis f. sp. tritici]|uniref:hypothetical protein n=1 Tax=Puccinia striiformis f. sp. tritici TaxID=168172 RepID=UPI002008802B|nr:hypothetical protein Pst134EA_029094 [Puccinia striiformis f. sp. tritici]KAH9447107.1 hypothetical protein Pst134EA_029094 [Puccinia striiformis f. sp. tritici]KAI7936219.1 hypothetical protein MJO29_015522 [Puccinia striiformis f. sp. tritici]